MDKATEKLACFAASLDFGDLSPGVIHAVKRRFIDTIGCALGAFSTEPAVITRNIASRVQSSPNAGIIGTHVRSSPDLAAFANGTMIRYLDFNDDYFGKEQREGPHPSDTIAAILAVADLLHASGRSFITGITVGYEILCSLVDAAGLRDKGWDYVTYTAIAAALGAGNVLQLSKDKMAHCLGLALIPNCALFETRLGELSMWKGLAGANACRNGVFASILAKEGMTGPPQPIEGKNGLWKQITGPFDIPSLGKSSFKVETVYLKNWPVSYTAQMPVQVALAIRDKVNVTEIESINVDTRLLGGALDPERWMPRTRETADHSIPFCIAAALLDGEITADTFDSKKFLEPEVVELMRKVRLREDPEFTKQFPEVWNCRITVITKSREQHRAHLTYPKGHPKNPMDDHEIEEKFMTLSKNLLSSERGRAFLNRAWCLEEVEDIGEIFRLVVI